MLKKVNLILVLLGAATTLACSRPVADNGTSSTIAFRTPKNLSELSKGVGALADSELPTNRKACYGVNVTGPNIDSGGGGTCSPLTGLIKGYVAAGELLEIEVPRGLKRRIELYVFLMKPGENGPCPTMAPSFSNTHLVQTYLLGSMDNVSLQKDVEEVTITANFPGTSQFLARQLNYPASCVAGVPLVPNRSGFHVSADANVQTGGGYKMFGRLGGIKSGQTLGNSQFKLKVVK